jgi:succinyl-diaminopimelate desuccinylase
MNDRIRALFEEIDGLTSAMIELQRRLTALPAVAPESGGAGESEKAAFLEEHVRGLGFAAVERFAAPDDRVPSRERPSLLATLPGRDRSRVLWIMTHLDVVPPGDPAAWQGDPFVLREADGRLYGRGTEDNQQSLVASLYALCAVKKLGLVPAADVSLLFAADEETGSAHGIKYLLDRYPERFRKPGLALVPDSGRPDGTAVEIAEKSILWLKVKTKGVQGHGSMPHLCKNAFLAASDLVLKIDDLNRAYARSDALFEPPVSTFSPTKKEANVPNVNTIPGDDVFYVDCRILPAENLDEVYGRLQAAGREIEQKYGVTVALETVQRESSPATQASSPLVARLKTAIKTVYGVEARPVGIGGGTVGAYLRRAGIDTAVWSRIDVMAHMPNEYCVIDNMVGDAKVMALLMLGEGDKQ